MICSFLRADNAATSLTICLKIGPNLLKIYYKCVEKLLANLLEISVTLALYKVLGNIW